MEASYEAPMATDEEAIAAFGEASSLSGWLQAGAPLLKTSAASKAAKDVRFKLGLNGLLSNIPKLRGLEQLHAIAFAWRLTSVSAMKSHRQTVIKHLQEPLAEPAVLPDGLEDPDDRRNLFEALSFKNDDWLATYLVRSLINEKDGVLVRRSATETLVIKQESLVTSLNSLAPQIQKLILQQKEPDVGRARLLIANLDAFSEAVWSHHDDLVIGNGFGESYQRLISSACRTGLTDKGLRVDLTKAAIRFFLRVARLEPTIASSVESYSFIKPLRVLFRPADWPDELSTELRRLAMLAAQQLVFLLKLGRPDNELRAFVMELRGPIDGSRLILGYAAGDTDLNEDDRFWLERGRGKSASNSEELAGQSVLARFDEELAELFRLSSAVANSIVGVHASLENEADLLPELVIQDLRRFLESAAKSGDTALRIAGRRGLKLAGRAGEVVTFDPLRHHALADAVGEKSVRLKTEVVERVLDGGRVVVVLKADVERI